MKPTIIALGVFLLVGGCYTPTPPARRNAPFIEAEYAPYKARGSGVIEGQAFSRNGLGEVRAAAGRSVYLNPVTSYSKEWWNAVVMSGRQIEPSDPRIDEFNRETKADISGSFKFEGLPPGEYYVFCADAWGWNYINYGDHVRLEEGKSLKIILRQIAGVTSNGGGWHVIDPVE